MEGSDKSLEHDDLKNYLEKSLKYDDLENDLEDDTPSYDLYESFEDDNLENPLRIKILRIT